MKFTVLKVCKKIADQPPAREGLSPNAERIVWDPDCPGLGLRLRGASTTGTWVWDRLLDAVSAAFDGDIVMIDSSCVRVHQHGGAVKRGATRSGEIVAWDVHGAG